MTTRTRDHVRLPAMLAILAGAVLAGGCASERAPARMIDEAPPDFAVRAVIIAPPGASASAAPREFRPAHYILEPDGGLRAAVGFGADERYPPFVTRLDAAEMERAWRLVRDSGLLEEGNPIRVSASEQFTIAGRTNADVTVTFMGEHHRFRTTLESGSPESAAVRRVIDHLAGEAYVER